MRHASIHPRTLGYLGRALSLEYSAVQQYMTQAGLAEAWGLKRGRRPLPARDVEEMQHAERMVKRMLGLGVRPTPRNCGRRRRPQPGGPAVAGPGAGGGDRRPVRRGDRVLPPHRRPRERRLLQGTAAGRAASRREIDAWLDSLGATTSKYAVMSEPTSDAERWQRQRRPRLAPTRAPAAARASARVCRLRCSSAGLPRPDRRAVRGNRHLSEPELRAHLCEPDAVCRRGRAGVGRGGAGLRGPGRRTRRHNNEKRGVRVHDPSQKVAPITSIRHATLRQLQLLEAIVRLGSFTRAAEELFLTQPTVSMQIKKLVARPSARRCFVQRAAEELFLAAQIVEPTDAGPRGLRRLPRDPRHADRPGGQALRPERAEARAARLGVVTTAKYVAPEILGAFCKQYPGIEVSLGSPTASTSSSV
jgi:DNA-binding MarR family transcriptional regulator